MSKHVQFTEKNKLIATFMGEKLNTIGGVVRDYHKSWDWLMPVVEKIESLGYSTRILDLGMGIEGNLIIERFGSTKIEGTYKTIIEFIIWYNQHSKP